MVKKQYRLALARLLKLYKEVETDKAVLVAEADDMEIGVEVFITTEDGDVIPAPDGEYKTDDIIYTVVGGTITAVVAIEPSLEMEEDVLPVEEEKDAKIAELEAIIAEKDTRIAELEAAIVERDNQIVELTEKNTELEATITELEGKVPESAEEKFEKQPLTNRGYEKKMAAASLVAKVRS